MNLATVLAVGVLNPALLGGLGLAAAPILIHLFSRRRYRRVPWGAMRFLLEADKKNRRRVRFEQWLLVALRCLAMLVLALLLARPFVRPGLVASVLGARERLQRIVVIDDSASLAYGTAGDLEFARLKEAATRLLSWLRAEAPADPVSVWVTSRPDEPLVVSATLTDSDAQDLAQRIDALEPSAARAHPRAAIEAVAAMLTAAGGNPQADVYVFSDFQRTDWITAAPSGAPASADASAGAPAATSVFEPLRAAAEIEARAVLVATAPPQRDNVAVTGIRLGRPQTLAGIPAVVQIDVANFTPRTLRDVQLRLEADGGPLPFEPIESIGPQSSRTVSTEVIFADEGHRELRASLEALDALGADDVRRAGVHVAETLRVLLINGQPALDPFADEVFLLRNALAPQGRVASGIRTETIDPSEIETTDLHAFDCVFLCNVPTPDEPQAEALQRFVAAGGGLVVFVGEEVADLDGYNQRFWRDGAGVLPLPFERIDSPLGSPGGVGMTRSGEHMITAAFAADTLSEYVRFRRYIVCDESRAAEVVTPETANAATASGGDSSDSASPSRGPVALPPVVLARYADVSGTPAIVEKAYGRGRVVVFTTTCDTDWNDWARSVDGSYLVTMQETVQYASRRGDSPVEFLAGSPLAVNVPADRYALNVTFRPPSFPDVPAATAERAESTVRPGEFVTLEGPPATELGTYQAELQRRSGQVETRLLAVNMDPAESDLAAAARGEIDAMMAGIPFQYVSLSEGFLDDEQQARHELWSGLLLSLVALLMIEQGLAWWFGGGSIMRERRRDEGR